MKTLTALILASLAACSAPATAVDLTPADGSPSVSDAADGGLDGSPAADGGVICALPPDGYYEVTQAERSPSPPYGWLTQGAAVLHVVQGRMVSFDHNNPLCPDPLVFEANTCQAPCCGAVRFTTFKGSAQDPKTGLYGERLLFRANGVCDGREINVAATRYSTAPF